MNFVCPNCHHIFAAFDESLYEEDVFKSLTPVRIECPLCGFEWRFRKVLKLSSVGATVKWKKETE